MGLDIGPDSIKSFSETLDTTKTVIWNGPMGVFEFEKFAAGTEVHSYIQYTLSFNLLYILVNGLSLNIFIRANPGYCKEAGRT